MRTIKFRGKRTDNGEWEMGVPFDIGLISKKERWLTSSIHIGILNGDYEHGLSITEVDPATVGQFTGLTDKNGKEIYEGDILRGCVQNKKDTKSKITSYLGTVIYKGSSFRFSDNKTKLDSDLDYLYRFDDIEIIGNVHDNKELLK